MQLHPNAKTTPKSRLEIVQRLWKGERPHELAQAFGPERADGLQVAAALPKCQA